MAGCSTPQQVDALRQLITHWKSVDHMIPAQQENIDEYTKLFELQVKQRRSSCITAGGLQQQQKLQQHRKQQISVEGSTSTSWTQRPFRWQLQEGLAISSVPVAEATAAAPADAGAVDTVAATAAGAPLANATGGLTGLRH